MIHPNNLDLHTIKPMWNKFTLAKFPVYILSLSNYILYKTDKKWIFVFQLILALTTHLVGLTLHAVYIFGIAFNEVLSSIPVILTYVFLSGPSYHIINAYLFLLKSLSLKTSYVLDLLDQTYAPHLWSFKYKVFMVFMIALAVIKFYFLYTINTFLEKDNNYHMILSFVEDKYQAQIIGRIYQAYLRYLLLYYAICPAYISYLCISLNMMINNLQQSLQEMIKKGGNSSIISDFESFTKDFDRMVDTVSTTNECHSLTIAWFIFLSLNQMIAWLYLEIVAKECHISEYMIVYILCDAICILIVLGMAASVYTKV